MSIRSYHINDVITFRKTNETFGGLSNMASGYSININGIIVKSSEHLYQAMRYPLNPEIQLEILSENSPMTAKMISKKYREKYTRPDWDKVKFQIMQWVLEIKLSQNWKQFGDLLKQTENKPIVELAAEGEIWGAVLRGSVLIGTNALGRLLMEIRERYVITNDYQRCVFPIDIPGFLLYNNQIEMICNDVYESDLIECEKPEFELA
jgi:ribA/ribD-fused uncharacterized protein